MPSKKNTPLPLNPFDIGFNGLIPETAIQIFSPAAIGSPRELKDSNKYIVEFKNDALAAEFRVQKGRINNGKIEKPIDVQIARGNEVKTGRILRKGEKNDVALASENFIFRTKSGSVAYSNIPRSDGSNKEIYRKTAGERTTELMVTYIS